MDWKSTKIDHTSMCETIIERLKPADPLEIANENNEKKPFKSINKLQRKNQTKGK